MDTTTRRLNLAAALFLTAVLIALVTMQLRNAALDLLPLIFDVAIFVAVVLTWSFALQSERDDAASTSNTGNPRSREHHFGARSRILKYATVGAIAVGAIGFVGGYFGPLIFTPESNQGPLLGIFITGPLGFMGGAVAGAVIGALRR